MSTLIGTHSTWPPLEGQPTSPEYNDRHAILFCGDHSGSQTFRNDLQHLYSTFRFIYGLSEANIHVLYEDGTASSTSACPVEGPGTKIELASQFLRIAKLKYTELFVVLMGHGFRQTTGEGGHPTLINCHEGLKGFMSELNFSQGACNHSNTASVAAPKRKRKPSATYMKNKGLHSDGACPELDISPFDLLTMFHTLPFGPRNHLVILSCYSGGFLPEFIDEVKLHSFTSATDSVSAMQDTFDKLHWAFGHAWSSMFGFCLLGQGLQAELALPFAYRAASAATELRRGARFWTKDN